MFSVCIAIVPVVADAALTVGSLLCLVPTGLFALLMLYGGYERLKKKRLVENVPTSKISGITLGLNEIKGTAVGDPPLKAPLTGEDAVFYMYRIQEYDKHGDRRTDSEWSADGESAKRSIFDVMHFKDPDDAGADENWATIDEGKKHQPFVLEDDTGQIRVRPTTTSLFDSDNDRLSLDLMQFLGDPVLDYTCGPDDPRFFELGPGQPGDRSSGKRRFREWIVPHGGEVYVMGPVQLRDDVVAPEVAADADTADIDHQFFLSTQSERNLGRRYFRQSANNYGCALGLVIASFWIYTVVATIGGWDSIVAPNILVASGVAFATWLSAIGVLYLKTIYDGLVELRNRERRAWAMLDVELKRRRDLIPKLVDIVKATAGHEQQLQQAATRARSTDTSFDTADTASAAQAIDTQTEALQDIFALAEDYPDVATAPHFEQLMDELSNCEQKIALARRFYNCSVERLNNRIETVPDMFIAPIAKAKKADFLDYSTFESGPANVEFDNAPQHPAGDRAYHSTKMN